jgi:hypothetical protein
LAAKETLSFGKVKKHIDTAEDANRGIINGSAGITLVEEQSKPFSNAKKISAMKV